MLTVVHALDGRARTSRTTGMGRDIPAWPQVAMSDTAPAGGPSTRAVQHDRLADRGRAPRARAIRWSIGLRDEASGTPGTDRSHGPR
jgi:hypothetical protein